MMFLRAFLLVLVVNETYAYSLLCFTSDGITTPRKSAGNVNSIAASKFNAQNDNVSQYPRQLVIFRAPSRHTYGFIDGTTYDLPEIELRNLLCSTVGSEFDVNFIPVEASFYDHPPQLNDAPTGKFQRQSKKKISSNIIPRNNQLLHWILCNGEISDKDLARAASRAILTHATFSIHETLNITNEDWQDAISNRGYPGNQHILFKFFDQMDIIDMSNPNMSRDSRSQLLETIVSIIMRQHELDYRLNQLCSAPLSRMSTHDVKNQQPVLIYQSAPAAFSGTNEPTPHRHCHRCIYFGFRTAIGLAGTSGAPSQTLRRPQRGILKEYALKNRQFTHVDNAILTSTAMEPEIGFLMANLALTGNDGGRVSAGSRILDPCCGSGRLLLYAAALGATRLTGVDSDSSVWRDAIDEFRNHRAVGSSTSSTLPVPVFFPGDVHIPTLTEALCIPNSVDAIICDPPYNIGAPVFVNGKDMRPRNHHQYKEVVGSEDHIINKVCDVTSDIIDSGDIISSILIIATNLLDDGGKIVFFLPARGEETKLPLEELLSTRGWLDCCDDSKDASDCSLQLLKYSSRKQVFSHTFCRWLVVMKKETSAVR
jgi:tRNA G10  N-methylase Trm11